MVLRDALSFKVVVSLMNPVEGAKPDRSESRVCSWPRQKLFQCGNRTGSRPRARMKRVEPSRRPPARRNARHAEGQACLLVSPDPELLVATVSAHRVTWKRIETSLRNDPVSSPRCTATSRC